MGSIGLDLPHKSSVDIHLVIATDEELLIQQAANSEEWRGALSIEAYMRREDVLANQELTKDGGLTGWMLVYQPDVNGPRQVLCGCETIRKKAMVARGGQIEDVVTHGIGSVFCPPQYRGQGYAGRMMVELNKRLKEWQAGENTPVMFSILFSDIGKDFYAAKGWQPFPSAHINLPPCSTKPLEDVRLLRKEDLGELCQIDESLIRSKLQKESTDRFAVALVPDRETLAWHHAREDFVSHELYKSSPEVKGVMVGSTPGSRVWAYFTRIWADPHATEPSVLHILRLVIEDEAFSDFSAASPEVAQKLKDSSVVRAVASIFAVAQDEAARWKMDEVSIWNPSSATLAAARALHPDAAIVHREQDSITSLQWYGKGSSWQDVDWVCNEKYGWC